MYSITGSMDSLPSGKLFEFRIYNPELTSSKAQGEDEIHNVRIVDISPLTIGSEGTEFGYTKAGEWEITIRPETKFTGVSDTAFFDILNSLQKPYFYANIYNSGSLFWRGVVSTDSIQSDIMDRTIRFNIVHETQNTSKLKCNDNPFRYVVRLGKVQSEFFFDKQYWIPVKKFYDDFIGYTTEVPLTGSVLQPVTASIVTGTYYTGSYTSSFVQDGIYFGVREVTGTPGFDIRFSFSASANLQEFTIHGRYQGSVSHNVNVDALASNGTWYSIGNWAQKSADFTYTCPVDQMYLLNDGTVNIRLYHTSVGNTSHYAYIDYVALSQKFEVTSSVQVDDFCPVIMKFYENIDQTYEYCDYSGIQTSVSGYTASLAINTNSFFASSYPDSPFPATIGELADKIGQSIGCRIIPTPNNRYVIDYMNDILKDTQNIPITDVLDCVLDYSDSFQGLTQNATGVYRYMWPNISSEDKMPKWTITMDYGTVPRKYNEISYLGEIIEKDRVRIGKIESILVSDWMPRSAGSDALAIGLAATYDIGNQLPEVGINTNGGEFFTVDGTIWDATWNQIYYQVAEDYLALNINARKKLQIECAGIDYDFTKTYTISDWFGTSKFKLLEIEYNYVDNFSRMWLLEIPS